MALFNRKPKNQSALPEIEQYYNAEKREHAGLAWILALVSIIVVALIIVGVFFTGRWVYHRFNKDDTKPVVATKDNSTSFDGDFNSDNSTDDNTSTDNGDQEVTPTVPTPTPSTNDQSVAPSTTAPNGNLPNTGPAGTLAVFVVSTAAATFAYSLYQKRQATR